MGLCSITRAPDEGFSPSTFAAGGIASERRAWSQPGAPVISWLLVLIWRREKDAAPGRDLTDIVCCSNALHCSPPPPSLPFFKFSILILFLILIY